MTLGRVLVFMLERTGSGHSNKYFCTESSIENIALRNSGVNEAVRNSESDAVFKEWANSQIKVSGELGFYGYISSIVLNVSNKSMV